MPTVAAVYSNESENLSIDKSSASTISADLIKRGTFKKANPKIQTSQYSKTEKAEPKIFNKEIVINNLDPICRAVLTNASTQLGIQTRSGAIVTTRL